MNIEIKYCPEDIVWLIEGPKALEAKVSSVDVCITTSLSGGLHIDAKYSLYNKGSKYPESLLFKTKEALLQSL